MSQNIYHDVSQYLRLRMYAKLLPFQELLLAAFLLCLRTDFAFFSCCMCLPVLKRRKNPTKRRKNPMKRQKQLRAQNVETETAKKTGNSENLGPGLWLNFLFSALLDM